MVMLGKGSSVPADIQMVERLRMLIHGEGPTTKKERLSFDINLTSPAAAMALGLMYLRTDRRDVAEILSIPDTTLGLNRVQPHFLLIRTLARALITFSSVEPNNEWLKAQIPLAISQAMQGRLQGQAVDDAFELAYYNIIAGACFAVALKYAGTAREEAYLLIIGYYDMFSRLAYTNGLPPRPLMRLNTH
jgi:anaphase-promoting complex subunit 1